MKLNSLIVMAPAHIRSIYGPGQLGEIESMTNLLHPPMGAEELQGKMELLEQTDLLFLGWDCGRLDDAFLEKAPRLKAVFYGAGSVRDVVSSEFWDRGIPITTAYAANAVPVAEFTFAQIIFALKKASYYTRYTKEALQWTKSADLERIPGCYGTTVGLVSLGMIGSKVLDFLQNLEVNIKVFDIRENEDLSREKNFEYATLEDIFAGCDVVSLHTANLPTTRKMIHPGLFSSMKKGAAFINTARGAIVDEEGMIQVLKDRPDLHVYLDVLYPEPPEPDNPLFSLPNAFITPHIAGSVQDECRRMGQMAVEECRRYLAGVELAWPVSRNMMETMA